MMSFYSALDTIVIDDIQNVARSVEAMRAAGDKVAKAVQAHEMNADKGTAKAYTPKRYGPENMQRNVYKEARYRK